MTTLVIYKVAKRPVIHARNHFQSSKHDLQHIQRGLLPSALTSVPSKLAQKE